MNCVYETDKKTMHGEKAPARQRESSDSEFITNNWWIICCDDVGDDDSFVWINSIDNFSISNGQRARETE